jgi:hypothetical protein
MCVVGDLRLRDSSGVTNMDDHFSRMLASSDADLINHASFIKANSFEGKRNGYAFRLGPRGLGYYIDPGQSVQPKIVDQTQVFSLLIYKTIRK